MWYEASNDIITCFVPHSLNIYIYIYIYIYVYITAVINVWRAPPVAVCKHSHCHCWATMMSPWVQKNRKDNGFKKGSGSQTISLRGYLHGGGSALPRASPTKRDGFQLAFTLKEPALVPRDSSLSRVTRANYIYFPTKPGIRYLRTRFHFITYT